MTGGVQDGVVIIDVASKMASLREQSAKLLTLHVSYIAE
jgi:hypothetical protein